MPRHDWLLYVAIAGIAFATALFWQSDTCGDSSYHGSQRQTVSVPKEKANPCDNSELISIQRIACTLEAINGRQDSEEETNRAQSDLDAQWKMAYWARCMFWASAIQAALGLLGLIAVFRTLKHTRDAVTEAANATAATYDTARIARESLELTRQSLAISKLAVDISDQASKRELRAYVMVAEAKITGGEIGQFPKFTVIIKNFGNTPATNVTISAFSGFQAFPLEADIPEREFSPNAPKHPIPPGGILKIYPPQMPKPLTQETLIALKSKNYALYAVGRVRYTDVFDNPQETDFCLYVGGAVGINNWELATYKDGNRVT